MQARNIWGVVLVCAALLLPAEAQAIGGTSTTKGRDFELVTKTTPHPKSGGRSVSSASGCRTVDLAHVGRDIFGFVVYKFHQVKNWCWSYPRITSKSVSTYVSDVDPNMEYRGIVGSAGYFYRWCCGNDYSGHYSFRQGKFENCVLWFPCTRTEYPWVKIWARGDGSFGWDHGL